MERALAWLGARGPAMEELLRELVETSSHTADKAGVDAVGALVRAVMPLPCEVVPSARFGDHLFFRGEGGGGVVLVGHLDTVFPRGSFEGYRVEETAAGVRLGRGPGVLDMKGGIVVVVFALAALREAGLLERVPVTVALVADEEVGSPESAAHLRAAAAGARYGLVFESGRAGDVIITRRKGTAGVTATVHGRAAHAGNAHREGANAIWAAARFVDRAQALTDYARGVTVNAGRIEGGIGKNTVPDRCRVELDFRFEHRADGEAVHAALRSLAAGVDVAGTRVELAGGIARNPLERTAASAALCERYASCQREAGLGAAEAELVGGGSDASTVAEAGVPAIDGLGPRGAGFHTVNERVELGTLVPKAEALVRFLAGLGGELRAGAHPR